jgi:hypothetical protein
MTCLMFVLKQILTSTRGGHSKIYVNFKFSVHIGVGGEFEDELTLHVVLCFGVN